MPSAFATRFSESARPQLDDRFGESVTLSRGDASTTGVVARCVSRGAKIETNDGMAVAHVDREWVIVKTAYLIDGAAVEPASGDRLTTSDGAVWEVMRQRGVPDKEEYAARLEWLIRTKRIAA
jgi:hypothetical protein